ncbi:hypothetical protein GOBAR_AA31741 [Gossypium barbadense]|uniref:RNA polymerase Rpb2 domain-containing protein n=1 Tax=Gossypium barbadense TaxID=3634 RepID=A0A2P5WCY9_GOSBA|nr:hypothetical protein GOBAR_AA31741 [Gossypium barbadense]
MNRKQATGPGIYYRSKLDHNGILVYTGTIISDWGERLELEIDRKAKIWARVSRKQKISILVLSSAMGSNRITNWWDTRQSETFLNDIQEKSILEQFIEVEELFLLDKMIKEYPETHLQKLTTTNFKNHRI